MWFLYGIHGLCSKLRWQKLCPPAAGRPVGSPAQNKRSKSVPGVDYQGRRFAMGFHTPMDPRDYRRMSAQETCATPKRGALVAGATPGRGRTVKRKA